MKKIWGIFWIIAAALGASSLWSVWSLPSESKNAFLLGMSKSKLAMCAGMAVLVIVCLVGAITTFMKRENSFSNEKAAGIASFILIFALVLGKIFLTPPIGKTALERSLLERLMPLAYWAFAFSVLALLLLFIQKFSSLWTCQTSSPSAIIFGIIVLLLIGGSLFYAQKSGVGLDPISGTFYRQGVSLLEGQLILPLLFLYPLLPLFTLLVPKFSEKSAGNSLTAVTAVLIWCAAVYFWQTTQFEGRSYFAPALRAPNYNYYPASDAENYDLLARSVLIGNGFRNGLTVVRPLYAAFLALLHWIFGNDYMRITNGQILLLALIPVLVFLIARHLHHAAAGILAAVWVIWREIYSIRVTPLVQVSNSRLLMSDLPTMLLVLSVILCAVRWDRDGQRSSHALLCGGLIGTAMLLRTQCFVLISAMWFLFLFSGKKASAAWRSLVLSLLGVAIVFAPWTVWQRIHPNTTANADVSEDQYLLQLYRNATGETDRSAGLFEMIKDHPVESFQAVMSHFLNNEISSLLVLPVRGELPTEAENLFFEEDLFWYRENERETIEHNTILIGVYVIVITFGIISACRKAGFAGAIPLLFHLVYNLGNALALTSGFRFILPVDWTLMFYFAVGCLALLEFLNRILLFSPQPNEAEVSSPVFAEESPDEESSSEALPDPVTEVQQHHRLSFVLTLMALALVGCILPFCDSQIPYRYSDKSQQQLFSEWQAVSSDPNGILSRYNANDLVFLEGTAFYPRYYEAGKGDSGGSSSAKRGLDMDRIVWMFHDRGVKVLNCSLTEEQVKSAVNTKVPDPLDVIVAGIPMDDYIEVIEMINITPSIQR